MATNAANDSAKAIIENSLDQYGLGSLADWVWRQYLQSGTNDPTAALQMIMPDLRKRPEYKARFPAMAALQARGQAISENDYVSYEKQAAQVMRNAGLPSSFYDSPDDYAKLLEANVSIAEVQSRVTNGYAQVANAPPEVRDAFHEFFGAQGDGALAAYFLDPQLAEPVLTQQMQAATIAGAGVRYGVGTDKGVDMRLAQQGVTQSQAEQGFGTLNEEKGLFSENVGENQDLTLAQTGVSAQFGLSPEAKLEVEQRQKGRIAATSGSGGAAATSKGVQGLGTSGQ